MRRFFAALSFLTILPVPAKWTGDESALARSVPCFPLVGVLIGGALALLALGLNAVAPWPVCSVLLVIAMLAASGGLHIDGLADTADGFMSSRPVERVLEIMQDSRTGPMGVAAIVCVLGLKAVALASLSGSVRWQIVFLMPIAGRCALVTVMSLLPYVRTEGGLGTIFSKARSEWNVFWAVLVMLAAGIAVCGALGAVVAVVYLSVTVFFLAYTDRKIGGYTGDTLGAVCEICEIVPPLVAGIWLHAGWGV